MLKDIPVVQPEEAMRFFREKGFETGFAWQDVWQEQHAHSFTVAKAMCPDLLADIRAEVDKALAEGVTLKDFTANLRPRLEARGWWGRQKMRDPLTGEVKTVQLGSPRRLRTIFQVNMRTAYMAGKWERIQRTKAAFPFLRYVSVMDGRERPQHRAWHGTIKPVDDPWWDTHYPPCGWNCRCTVQPVTRRTMKREGWTETEKPASFPAKAYTNPRTGEVIDVPGGIDPGWAYNVGKAKLGPGPIPPAPGGVVPATKAHVEAFLDPFGIKPGESIEIRDKRNYPHTISDGWLRNAAGALVVPSSATPAAMRAAGETIAHHDKVLWAWVTARNGRQVLMRRFLKRGLAGGVSAARVEVGALGWRMQVGDVSGEAIPPAQRALEPFVERALNTGQPIATLSLGPISKRAAVEFRRLGFEPLARKRQVLKEITLEAQRARHQMLRHANDSRGQVGTVVSDFGKLAAILDAGSYIRTKHNRVLVKAELDGVRYEASFEVRGKAVAFISMRKRAS